MYSNKSWACPFFGYDLKIGNKYEVHCEGGCTAFPSREAYDDYAKKYCAQVKDWERCSIAQMLVEDYERREGK